MVPEEGVRSACRPLGAALPGGLEQQRRRPRPRHSGFPRRPPSGCRPAGRSSPGSAGAGPAPSAPSTSASGPVSSASNSDFGAWSSAPTIQISRSFSQRSVRARFVTWISGTRFGGAGRDLAHRRREAGRPVARHDDRVRAGGIGGAQAGAEVVRVLHAVQHQQQRRRGRAIEQLVQRAFAQRTARRESADTRPDDARRPPVDRARRRRAIRSSRLPLAPVAPTPPTRASSLPFCNSSSDSAFGPLLQQRAHGVQPEDDASSHSSTAGSLRRCHGPRIARAPPLFARARSRSCARR